MKALKGGWTLIDVDSSSTSTSLVTSTQINQGDTLILYNSTDGFKTGTAGTVTFDSTTNLYTVDISSFGLTSAPEKAYIYAQNAIWVSKTYEQEPTDNDWYQYQVTVTEKPKEISILSTSTNTTLNTSDEVVTGEKVVLYNASDGFKEGNLGSVVKKGKPWDISLLFELPREISSIPSNGSNVTKFCFKNNGFCFYIDNSSDIPESGYYTITYYKLSIPYDLSTATFIGKFVPGFNSSYSFDISSDGTKLFLFNATANSIRQHNLSTPWDITTASKYSDASSSTLLPEGGVYPNIYFTPDGTKVFLHGTSSGEDRIFEFNLLNSWDISSIQYYNNYSFSGTKFYFSDDGYHLYVYDPYNGCFIYYYLTTQFDLSTATKKSVAYYGDDYNVYLALSNDGKTAFISPFSSGYKICVVDLTNYYQADISSFNLTNPPEKAWKEPTKVYIAMESNPDRCLYFDEDISTKITNTTTSSFEFQDTRKDLIVTGDTIIVNGNSISVSDSKEIAVIDNSTQLSYDISSVITNITGIVVSKDGTKLFLGDGSDSSIKQFTLSTSWDITTVSYDNIYRVFSSDATHFCTNDGLTWYLRKYSSTISNYVITKFVLTSPYDLNTYSYYTDSDSESAIFGTQIVALTTKNLDNYVYCLDINYQLHQYNFGSSIINTVDLSSILANNIASIAFSEDDSTLFIIEYDDTGNRWLHSIRLIDPTNIATLDLTNVVTINITDGRFVNVSNNYLFSTSISTTSPVNIYRNNLVNSYRITVPDQDSTITSVIIPQRTIEQSILYRSYDSNNDVIISKYQPVKKVGRALRVKFEGNTDNYVNEFNVDLWTG